MSYNKKKIYESIVATAKYGSTDKAVTLQTAKDIWGYDFAPTLAGLLLGIRKPMSDLWGSLFGTRDAAGNNRGDGLIWIQGFLGRGLNPLGKPIMGVSQSLMNSTINSIDPGISSVQQATADAYDSSFPATKGVLSSFWSGNTINEALLLLELQEDKVNITSDETGYDETEYEEVEEGDPEFLEDEPADSETSREIPLEIINALNNDASRWATLKQDIESAETFPDAVDKWQEFFNISVGTAELRDNIEMAKEEGNYDDANSKRALSSKILPEYGRNLWRLVITSIKRKMNLSDQEMLPIYKIYSRFLEII